MVNKQQEFPVKKGRTDTAMLKDKLSLQQLVQNNKVYLTNVKIENF